MQAICIFANFSVIVDAIPSKLSQGFVPVMAAKIKVIAIIVGTGGKIPREAAMGIRKALKD